MNLVTAICHYSRLLSGLTLAALAFTLVGAFAVIGIVSLVLGGLLYPLTDVHPYALAAQSLGDMVGPALSAAAWSSIVVAFSAAIAGFGLWCLRQVSSPGFLSAPSTRRIARAIRPWVVVNLNTNRQIKVLAGALPLTAPSRVVVSTTAALAGAAPLLN